MIDPDEIDNAINVFKNKEFRVIEITKAVENFLEECKEFDTLYETNFEKPFDRDITSKPGNSKTQRSSRSMDSNLKCPYSSSLENLNHPNLLLIPDHLKNYY